MRKLNRALILGLMLGLCPAILGCGETSDSKPVMVVPDVPPAESSRGSMDSYLKAHPAAAKTANKEMPK